MIETFKEIETNYPVEKITCNGIQIWPFIRIYIADQLLFKKNRSIQPDRKLYSALIKDLTLGFNNYFKKFDHLFFSDTKERKSLHGKMVDKSVGFIASELKDGLILELPLPHHFSKDLIPDEHIASKLPLFILTTIYSKIRLRSIKITEEDLLKEILSKYKVDIDYIGLTRKNLAQYHVGKFLFKRFGIKSFFVVCYYTNMGFIKAARELNIKTVELQHGVINETHHAYNLFKKFDPDFFPEYLFSYGTDIFEVLKKNPFFINPKNVYNVGHYYISAMAAEKVESKEFENLRSNYSRSIAFTAQDAIEEKALEILIPAASRAPELLFIYIPRSPKPEFYNKLSLPSNIVFMPQLNTYELIKLCDIHSTVFSTCAIEAPAMGKQNVLINLDNFALQYYPHLFQNRNLNEYADSHEEYVQKIKSMKLLREEQVMEELSRNTIQYITPDYKKNIKKALKEVLG